MGGHADVWIISAGPWGGNENEIGVKTGGFVGATDQFASDSASLKGLGDSQIRQVGTVAAIRERAGDADEVSLTAGGEDDVGLAQHAVHAQYIINRAALGQGGALQHGDEFADREAGFNLVVYLLAHREVMAEKAGLEREMMLMEG